MDANKQCHDIFTSSRKVFLLERMNCKTMPHTESGNLIVFCKQQAPAEVIYCIHMKVS